MQTRRQIGQGFLFQITQTAVLINGREKFQPRLIVNLGGLNRLHCNNPHAEPCSNFDDLLGKCRVTWSTNFQAEKRMLAEDFRETAGVMLGVFSLLGL